MLNLSQKTCLDGNTRNLRGLGEVKDRNLKKEVLSHCMSFCRHVCCAEASFIPANNKPSSHACMDIWRLPRGSNTPLPAAGYLIPANITRYFG